MTMIKILIATLLAALSFQAYGDDKEWCVADVQTPDDVLMTNMNWACKNGADCTNIQLNHNCYYPNTIKAHASYVFNSYYQRFKHKGASCYFGAAAITSDLDPSHNRCIYEYLP